LYATERLLEHGVVPGLKSVKGARVAVQGFGDVGSVAARLFREAGAIIVAVSDSRGGVFSAQGLDVDAALAFKAAHGTVVGLPGAKTITNEALIDLECEILLPAALESQIRRDNAPRVKARMICEGANGPTTPAADDILGQAGIAVLPDILANAGGVTVSYFEWVQNIENEQWTLEEVNTKLRQKMRQAVDSVMDRWGSLRQESASKTPNDRPIDLRTAALVVAIETVARVALKRGIWP
jgi:glutamate dehydrogenase (NAD(P)+)